MIYQPVLGIDPGCEGGIALLAPNVPPYALPIHGDMTQRSVVDIVELMMDLLFKRGSHHVFIETVGYMPRDGGQGANTFGRIDGLLRGAVLMKLGKKHTLREVAPQRWQGKLDCLTGGNKNISKRKAKEIFPGMKITHNLADALLIARYGQLELARQDDDLLEAL